jgi:hypothetical protein
MVDIPNYFERAVALLASQFQIRNPDGSLTNFQKVVKALSGQAQVLNTQEQLLQTMRYLNTAEGVQLDGLGQILGLARIPGQTDASYREDLQFQIFINQSHGTPEEMITILKYLTDATTIWYDEFYPAAYLMTTNGLIFPANPSDLVQAIQNVSPAGVSFAALLATYNTNPFVFSGDPFDEQLYVAPNIADPNELHPFQVDPGTGLADFFIQRGETTDPNFGGGFAEAIGEPPNFIRIDTTGAGQMTESIQINGNIPPAP